MKQNPLVVYRDHKVLNPFTKLLKDICDEKGKCLVRLENGEICFIVNIYIKTEEDLENYIGFDYELGEFIGFKHIDNNYCYSWYCNGISPTSMSYNIFEIIEEK